MWQDAVVAYFKTL